MSRASRYQGIVADRLQTNLANWAQQRFGRDQGVRVVSSGGRSSAADVAELGRPDSGRRRDHRASAACHRERRLRRRRPASARAAARRELPGGPQHGAARARPARIGRAGVAPARQRNLRHGERPGGAGHGRGQRPDQPAATDRGPLHGRALHDAARGAERHPPRPRRHARGADPRGSGAPRQGRVLQVGFRVPPLDRARLAQPDAHALLQADQPRTAARAVGFDEGADPESRHDRGIQPPASRHPPGASTSATRSSRSHWSPSTSARRATICCGPTAADPPP